MLHDPKEKLPPSNGKALERFVRAGAQLGCDVELITRADYGRLAEFDALFIRETTALDHHTYRFAKKAESEGMPVIDDPRSILKCTNKIYLAELLQANGVPCPRTLILDRRRNRQDRARVGLSGSDQDTRRLVLARRLQGDECGRAGGHCRAHLQGDGPDHRPGVHGDSIRLASRRARPQSAVRLPVLYGTRPLADRQARQFRRGRRGWGANLCTRRRAAKVVEIATRAASLIGSGLYGVDLKQNERGVFVVEVNDNPNIDAGVEDAVLKDELYRAVIGSLVRRLEKRMQPGRGRNGNALTLGQPQSLDRLLNTSRDGSIRSAAEVIPVDEGRTTVTG